MTLEQADLIVATIQRAYPKRFKPLAIQSVMGGAARVIFVYVNLDSRAICKWFRKLGVATEKVETLFNDDGRPVMALTFWEVDSDDHA